MVAVKSHLADNFIKDPGPAIKAYLVFGGDEGRVNETAHLLAKNWRAKFGDGGEIIHIDERSLASNPDSLAVELGSVAMFGGLQVVRAKICPRIKPAMIKELLALKPENLLILEAGNLPASSAFRKLFEKSKDAAAIACYADEARDIIRLIDDELVDKGISITPTGRKLLSSILGGDRGVSRMELQKLALYAHDKPQIDVEDILACIGDSSQLAYDQIVSLTLSGAASEALVKLDRLLASGQNCAGLTIVLGRHLARLYKVRVIMDAGRSARDAVASLRPPVFFKQRDAITAQAARLNLKALARAIHLVQETTGANRQNASLERVKTERMIIILAHLAR